MAAAASRDPEAFGVFYHRHVDHILNYFCSRTDNSEDAAELTAETFAEALSRIGKYRKWRGHPADWLRDLAYKQFRSYTRSNQVSDQTRRRLGIQTPSTAPMGWDDFEAADARLDAERIRSALYRLTPGYRKAVEMRIIDQLGYDEIAERLGCKPGAARVRVLRGLRRLEREFEDGSYPRLKRAEAERAEAMRDPGAARKRP